jgi:hypothetical protein
MLENNLASMSFAAELRSAARSLVSLRAVLVCWRTLRPSRPGADERPQIAWRMIAAAITQLVALHANLKLCAPACARGVAVTCKSGLTICFYW